MVDRNDLEWTGIWKQVELSGMWNCKPISILSILSVLSALSALSALSVYLSICPSIYLFVCVCLSVYLSISLSLYLSISLSLYLSLYLSILSYLILSYPILSYPYLSFFLSIYLSICPNSLGINVPLSATGRSGNIGSRAWNEGANPMTGLEATSSRIGRQWNKTQVCPDHLASGRKVTITITLRLQLSFSFSGVAEWPGPSIIEAFQWLKPFKIWIPAIIKVRQQFDPLKNWSPSMIESFSFGQDLCMTHSWMIALVTQQSISESHWSTFQTPRSCLGQSTRRGGKTHQDHFKTLKVHGNLDLDKVNKVNKVTKSWPSPSILDPILRGLDLCRAHPFCLAKPILEPVKKSSDCKLVKRRSL